MRRAAVCNRYVLTLSLFWVTSFLFFAMFVSPVYARTVTPVESLLSLEGFPDTWVPDGKPKRFDPSNLYEHINGEAELFISYGFKEMATILLTRRNDGKMAIQADIYRMGSPVDAFGIFSVFRSPDIEEISVGESGFIEESQAMFYRGDYFVRLNASGSGNPDRNDFLALAKTISQKIPPSSQPTRELSFFRVPEIHFPTVKYYGRSLLGYSFFEKGFTAEAKTGDIPVKLFVVVGKSDRHASDILMQYEKHLTEKGIQFMRRKISGQEPVLLAQDDLYKGVAIVQRGPYLLGVSGSKKAEDSSIFLEKWLIRISVMKNVPF